MQFLERTPLRDGDEWVAALLEHNEMLGGWVGGRAWVGAGARRRQGRGWGRAWEWLRRELLNGGGCYTHA